MRFTTLSIAEARDLLTRMHPAARLRPDAVAAYAQAMREGSWVMNGVPVTLSREGRLLDGVQRLSASVEAGIPLAGFLAENVEDSAFHTIDQHRHRSFAALLKQRGFAHHHLLAALALRLARYEEGLLGQSAMPAISWVRLWHILSSTTPLQDALAESLALPDCPLPEPVRSMAIFMGRQVNPTMLERLLDVLLRPEHYPANEPGITLLDEIQRSEEVTESSDRILRLIAVTILAMNAMLRGETPRRLLWLHRTRGERPADPFPQLEGYPGLRSLAPGPVAPRAAEENFTCQIESIDPATAGTYLVTGHPARQPIASLVEALSGDIARGRWMPNAQPICFTRDGYLADGQHRLLAVIAAGRTIEVPVIRGLPDAACASYDIQPRRAAAAEDPAGDFGDQPLAIAMANLLWRHERKAGVPTRHKRASAAEIREILTQHPRLIELRGFARRMVDFGRSSVMGYGAYVIERDDPRLAPGFLQALTTGADLPPGHPALTTRTSLQRLRRDRAGQDEQLATLLAGWRRYKALPQPPRAR
ncbi:hypothetical protein EBE87_27175 [Pseudoroseomonas wenyumeiae]|uniref:ParB/Sulfiredoxin domain-containing protein n=1 Tax=Teichococcus wenyumeiae TaxID=2478470 RepID=A0A3A9JM49_9PROT|nr:hypothetical protein [Pseudoroseomonas wenyumeiae]RKK01648.1 hypothetical protein D6Z83_23885 [Pseudoroseomonas wenyumeiae]RMI15112.1 hypothetical protein EBE87_27175 [Pseudoroseomonas wenyumeiae]